MLKLPMLKLPMLKLPMLMLRRPKLLALAAASTTFLYLLYRSVRSASVALVANATNALNYLAWRDEQLASYSGKSFYDPVEAGGVILESPTAKQIWPRADALVVHGNSMVAVPLAAADLFVDVLHPAGCRTVLLTGGVGTAARNQTQSLRTQH